MVLATRASWWRRSRLLDPDETYYFLWSRFPALSYYDHPGMVAWWMAAGTAIFGDGPFGIRVVSVPSMIPTSLAVYATGLVLFDRRIALRGVLWTNATLLFVIAGMFATPDAPSVLFWSLAALGLALLGRSGDGRWWLLAGLAGRPLRYFQTHSGSSSDSGYRVAA